MRLSITGAALAGTAVQAFSNTSPFVMFSTSTLDVPSVNTQIQTSKQVLASVQALLSNCPTERYLLVSQPNTHAVDLRYDSTGDCSLPSLCHAVKSGAVKGTYSVAEVLGQVEMQQLEAHVKSACAGKGKTATMEQIELRQLPAGAKRSEVLGDNDNALQQSLDALQGDYTVLFFSDSTEGHVYEPEFAEPVHMDLKRNSEAFRSFARDSPAQNGTDKLPLFEKYQFFTAGVFMGGLVLIMLLSILGVGLKAIASLQVPYGAFDKEMGPAAQKKQM